ncbi:glycosyltransferase family A protein [Ammoniphilus sp. YIM 78166]|uniref:glycosyltransferase family A protein n=1 Tax=Ammoniphilus sp. YIM 78166 TaxID=1644106 RepID=UPI00142FBBDD
MSIFMKFTAQSLKNQTNKNFIALVQYADQTEHIIRQTLKKYPKLPGNIRFIKGTDFEQEVARYIAGSESLYMARLDSDDMYHKTFIQQLHDYKPKKDTQVLINQKGYIYNSLNHTLSTYTRSSPPFFTFIYDTEKYLAGKRYKINGHNDAIKLPHEVLKPLNFIVVIHNANTMSKFTRENMVTDSAKIKQILQQFMGSRTPALPKKPANFKRRVNAAHWNGNTARGTNHGNLRNSHGIWVNKNHPFA